MKLKLTAMKLKLTAMKLKLTAMKLKRAKSYFLVLEKKEYTNHYFSRFP